MALYSILFALMAGTAEAAASVYNSLPYRSQVDSPLLATIMSGETFVEDFENGALNTPGLSMMPGGMSNPLRWSVDGDDGTIDGIGRGYSWLSSGASLPNAPQFSMEIRFDMGGNGQFPTHAGLVLLGFSTSSTVQTMRNFQAFDSNGILIAESFMSVAVPNFPGGLDGFSSLGDRFFGLIHEAGISRILVSGTHFDHIQFGYGPIPEPGSAWLAAAALAGLGGSRRRRVPGRRLR